MDIGLMLLVALVMLVVVGAGAFLALREKQRRQARERIDPARGRPAPEVVNTLPIRRRGSATERPKSGSPRPAVKPPAPSESTVPMPAQPAAPGEPEKRRQDTAESVVEKSGRHAAPPTREAAVPQRPGDGDAARSASGTGRHWAPGADAQPGPAEADRRAAETADDIRPVGGGRHRAAGYADQHVPSQRSGGPDSGELPTGQDTRTRPVPAVTEQGNRNDPSAAQR